MSALAVGLVGAGPWATVFHAPLFAAGPETMLSGVWARSSAETLARRHDTVACTSFEELLDRSEAIAFAVAPTVQPVLARIAAAAGKAVLLEKPIATDLVTAQELTDSVQEAGVGSLVNFTARFATPVRSFLDDVRDAGARGARACWISGALRGGAFAASPWRNELGALYDLGPHALDLVTAALGPVDDVCASTSPGSWTSIILRHCDGPVTGVSICGHAAGTPRSRIEVAGAGKWHELDVLDALLEGSPGDRLRADFVAVARSGTGHACDVRRGLEIQELLTRIAGKVVDNASR